jgi:hypothetical protein
VRLVVGIHVGVDWSLTYSDKESGGTTDVGATLRLDVVQRCIVCSWGGKNVEGMSRECGGNSWGEVLGQRMNYGPYNI